MFPGFSFGWVHAIWRRPTLHRWPSSSPPVQQSPPLSSALICNAMHYCSFLNLVFVLSGASNKDRQFTLLHRQLALRGTEGDRAHQYSGRLFAALPCCRTGPSCAMKTEVHIITGLG